MLVLVCVCVCFCIVQATKAERWRYMSCPPSVRLAKRTIQQLVDQREVVLDIQFCKLQGCSGGGKAWIRLCANPNELRQGKEVGREIACVRVSVQVDRSSKQGLNAPCQSKTS